MPSLIKKSKLKTLSKWKKELDAIFSKYVRLRDNDTCYTCNLKMEHNRSQNGHFVPRQYMATRFDETNCHCQCYACNMLYNGQPSRYAQRLRQEYGDEIIDSLEFSRNKVFKVDSVWYQGKIDHYRSEVARMLLET